MLALLKLLLSEVAAQHRVAVLVDSVGEVLAGHADHAALAVLQVAVIDESHSFITSRDSMAVLMQSRRLATHHYRFMKR